MGGSERPGAADSARSGLGVALLVARRQLASMRRERRVALLLGFVALLGIASALSARHHAVREAEQRSAHRALVERQWAEQPDRHPHRVIHYGFLVFREDAPLAFFDPGVGAWTGTSLYLEGHRQNSASFGDARHATAMLGFGRLTPVAVLALVLPLLVIAVGFASVSAERERGTLPLILAQGATPGQVLAGKAMGVAAVAVAAALPVFATSVALAVSSGAEGWSVARTLALAAIWVAYVAGWALATVWTSSRRASSRAALVQLVAIWVVVCVAVPRLGASLAGGLHPAPSRARFTAEVEEALRAVGDSHDPDDAFFRALRDETLARYRVDSVEELPVNWGGIVSREGEALTSRIAEERHQALVAVHRRQDRALAWLGLLSPNLAARDLSMAAAGTGPEAIEAFRREAEAHRYAIVQRLNDLHIHEIAYENDRAQRIAREEWTRFPVFRSEPPSLGRALSDRPQSLAALGLWIAVPLAGLALARGRLLLGGADGGRRRSRRSRAP